jgi:hypothetical protein
MRDRDIRSSLRALLRMEHPGSDDLLIDELPLCGGESRIDMALINGRIEGFEIKSQQDSLSRLEQQRDSYGKVCDHVTLVAHERWVEQSEQIIPEWWGLVAAVAGRDRVTLDKVRDAGLNPSPDPYSVAQLLWRDEALQVLAERGLDHGVRSKPRRVLWSAVADRVEPDELRQAVRSVLKAREAWPADSPSRPGGERRRP